MMALWAVTAAGKPVFNLAGLTNVVIIMIITTTTCTAGE